MTKPSAPVVDAVGQLESWVVPSCPFCHASHRHRAGGTPGGLMRLGGPSLGRVAAPCGGGTYDVVEASPGTWLPEWGDAPGPHDFPPVHLTFTSTAAKTEPRRWLRWDGRRRVVGVVVGRGVAFNGDRGASHVLALDPWEGSPRRPWGLVVDEDPAIVAAWREWRGHLGAVVDFALADGRVVAEPRFDLAARLSQPRAGGAT